MATDRHQAPSYPLRMPDDLKAKMIEAAEKSGRSLHGELLQRLQESLHPHPAEERVQDLKNAVLAQTSLIAIQGAFIGHLADMVPKDDPNAKAAREIARKFGTPLFQESIGEAADAVRKLAGFGAKLRIDNLNIDSFGRAMDDFLGKEPDGKATPPSTPVRKTSGKSVRVARPKP